MKRAGRADRARNAARAVSSGPPTKRAGRADPATDAAAAVPGGPSTERAGSADPAATVTLDDLKFDGAGLIPAVVQEAETGEVLMVAWMDRPALEATLSTGLTHFWSRSRRSPWRKGETSGNVQHVEAVHADCDGDVLLVQVHQEGVACHTGRRSCFFNALRGEAPASATMLERLERIIAARKSAAPPGSYVAGLLARGQAAVCRKIGEEAVEVITAALGGEGDGRVTEEVADLWFHSLVLLGQRGIALREVLEELARRHARRAASSG